METRPSYQMGLLHQMVWGLVGTSYRGYPLNVGRSSTVNIFGARRRARWQDVSSHHVLNLCISIMDHVTLIPLQCFSHVKPLNITREFSDLLFKFTYDGEGKVAWLEYLEDFYAFLNDADNFYVEEVSLLLSYTLRESQLRWCWSLPVGSVHSLKQFYDLIEYTFHHFDLEPLDQKMSKKWKTRQESPMEF